MSRGSKKLVKFQYSQSERDKYLHQQRLKRKQAEQEPDYLEWQAAIKAYNTDVKQREECNRLGIVAAGTPLAPVPRSLSAYIKSRDYMSTYSGKMPFKRDRDYDSVSGEIRAYDAPRYDYVYREVGLHHKQQRESYILNNGGRFKRIIHGGDILRRNRSEDGITRVHVKPKRELRKTGNLDLPSAPRVDYRTQYLNLYWWRGNPGESGNIPLLPTHQTVEQNFKQGEVQ